MDELPNDPSTRARMKEHFETQLHFYRKLRAASIVIALATIAWAAGTELGDYSVAQRLAGLATLAAVLIFPCTLALNDTWWTRVLVLCALLALSLRTPPHALWRRSWPGLWRERGAHRLWRHFDRCCAGTEDTGRAPAELTPWATLGLTIVGLLALGLGFLAFPLPHPGHALALGPLLAAALLRTAIPRSRSRPQGNRP